MPVIDILQKIFIPLIAAFIGAVLAFWSQRIIRRTDEKKAVFGALMGYRNWGTTEPDFVKALNLVIVVFPKNEKVKEALRKYLTAFRSKQYSDGERLSAIFHLLDEMAKDIGYTDLKHNDIKDYFVQTFPEPSEKIEKID